MGLLNVGKNEGSQIIQLFGRGVRLRGKDMSLKRSAVLHGEHPRNLSILETLNIFAVRANFMEEFRTYLNRESVSYEGQIEMELPITLNPEFLNSDQDLCLPKAPSYHEVAKGQCVLLTPNLARPVTHKMQIIDIIPELFRCGYSRNSSWTRSATRPYPRQESEIDKLGMDLSPTS